MYRRLLVAFCLCACQTTEPPRTDEDGVNRAEVRSDSAAKVTEAVPVTLTLHPPPCAPMALSGIAVPFRATSDPPGRVAVELRTPDGRVRLLGRFEVEASGSSLLVPEALVQAGTNTISIYAVQADRTSTVHSFVLQAVAPIAGASVLDEDGDCVSPAAGDCDDANPAIHLGATELCDDLDNDCDGRFDESFDTDGDGYAGCPDARALTHTVSGDACPAGYASCEDCNDADDETRPGAVNGFCEDSARSCVSHASTTIDPANVHVNIANPSSGDGSEACPFRRISDAIGAAATNGTVYVSAGLYSAASGEQFPLRFDRAITLEGASASATIIEGSGSFDVEEHNGFFKNYPHGTGDPKSVTVWAHNPTGALTLRHLTLRPPIATASSGVLCDRGNASPLARPVPVPSPNFIMDDIRLGPGYVWSGYIVHGGAGSDAQGCNARLVRSTIEDNKCGFWAAGTGAGANNEHRVHFEVGTDAASGNTFTRIGEAITQVGMCRGASLMTWDAVSPLFLRGNNFSSSTRGAEITNHAQTPLNLLEITDNVFTAQKSHGLYLGNATVVDKLLRNHFEGNSGSGGWSAALAMFAGNANTARPFVLAARGNVFFANDFGVYMDYTQATESGYTALLNDFSPNALPVDQDPGPNVFACNDRAGSSAGADFMVADPAGDQSKSLRLSGNQWDRAPPLQRTSLSASGLDLIIAVNDALYAPATGASVHTRTCPSTRTR